MKKTIIRPMRSEDNQHVAAIIRTVMPEFGAGGEGFAIHDKEVEDMYTAYSKPRCRYFVCEYDKEIVGGGGIAPLEGADELTCELKKMCFLRGGRGIGLGQRLLSECLRVAKEIGFHYCYLETYNTMKDAMKLYQKNGFIKIPGPLGNTGHFDCDTFYQLDLRAALIAKDH